MREENGAEREEVMKEIKRMIKDKTKITDK